MKNIVSIKKFALTLLVCLPIYAFANGQSYTGWNGSYGGYGGGWNGGGGNSVPLDGGLSFLAIAGIGYGIKKYADKNKENVVK